MDLTGGQPQILADVVRPLRGHLEFGGGDLFTPSGRSPPLSPVPPRAATDAATNFRRGNMDFVPQVFRRQALSAGGRRTDAALWSGLAGLHCPEIDRF